MKPPTFAGVISSSAVELILEALGQYESKCGSIEQANIYKLINDLTDPSKSVISLKHEETHNESTESKTK